MTVSVHRIGYNGKMGLHDLDFGAIRDPGRWHTPVPGARTSVVYSAGSRALAQLEKRVHANGVEPANMALLRLDLADGAELRFARDLGLRADWRSDEGYTQMFGNNWLVAQTSLGLWVPSYVEDREHNLLLNPDHPQYGTHVSVVIEERAFHFDPRMFDA